MTPEPTAGPTEREKINRDEFVSVVLHQLRTPLTGSLWAHEMMLAGEMGPVNDEQHHYLTLSHESIRLALASIGDVLLYENSTPNSTDYTLIKSDFKALVEKIVYDMAPQAQKKNVRISFDYDTALSVPQIVLDRKKIAAVVENLLENAIKYSPAGGPISIIIEVKDKRVILSVKDNGIGIPEKEQGRIFSRFFRASNAEEQEEGMGIGLYIGKHIVEMHRGKLWFESAPGTGTVFHLELPVVEPT